MRIEVRDLTYVYNKGMADEVIALDSVSFSVESGSFVGIVGHTGSGKSTLIQHLNGLLRPSSGKVILDRTDITATDTKMADIRKKIGLVFQYPEYQLFEETVAKDVAFGPKNMGLSPEEIDARVHEALETVGLPYDEFAERSPFDLSGGQKRRVAIAGVIAMRPEVLILDEPAAGLDPRSHREMLDMIRGFHRSRGTTILLVSHNMDDVAEYCGSVLVIDGGRLVFSGTPREVFAHGEELERIGLGLPSGAELVHRMNEMGAGVETEAVLTDGDAADAVFRWLGKRGAC